MTMPVEGIRVLDLASMMAGPYEATMLGDMGADVIKVEPVYGDEARTRGTAENPLSAEEFEGKFRRLAAAVLPAERVDRLAADLRRFATLPDVARLVALAVR